jgi:hypothetical protein
MSLARVWSDYAQTRRKPAEIRLPPAATAFAQITFRNSNCREFGVFAEMKLLRAEAGFP